MKLLLDFINNVLAMNATNGTHLKPHVTYLKIKEAMSNRIWCKGINRESCQTGRDPYSWTRFCQKWTCMLTPDLYADQGLICTQIMG